MFTGGFHETWETLQLPRSDTDADGRLGSRGQELKRHCLSGRPEELTSRKARGGPAIGSANEETKEARREAASQSALVVPKKVANQNRWEPLEGRRASALWSCWKER